MQIFKYKVFLRIRDTIFSVFQYKKSDRAAGIDHGRSIRDILAIRNIVALRLIFEYSQDMGLYI
jgi:hypothetical protein